MAKKSKYAHFEVCSSDYNDAIVSGYKDALEAYRSAEAPKSLFGVTSDGITIPIYAKQK